MSFLPEGYEIPEPEHSNYLEFAPGETRVRVLSDALTAWQYWTTAEGKVSSSPVKGVKPVYVRELSEIPKVVADDVNLKLKVVWLFVVWNYAAEQVQICKLTQTSLMRAIDTYYRHPDFGSPKNFDLLIQRTGEGLSTSYQVLASNKAPIDPGITAMYQKMAIDLEAVLRGEDPFAAESEPAPAQPQPQAVTSQPAPAAVHGNGIAVAK